MTSSPLHIAIVGGGLCGLSLANALRTHNIPFNLYEARSSFTELGAGINVGPNTSTALKLISPSLAEAFFQIANRNAPPNEDVYLDIRLGAASGEFGEGEVIESLLAPPTGNTTVGRNALLQLLAERAGLTTEPGKQDAVFNKKLSSFTQTSNDGVTLTFEDGSTASATALVACDGIHSAVRRLLLEPDDPAAESQYTEAGAYRAILPIDRLTSILGPDRAKSSQCIVGPRGYVIYYPTTPTLMNVGFWTWRKGSWDHPSWVLQGQRENLVRDFGDWGEQVRGLLGLVEGETAFWAGFCHVQQMDACRKGRVGCVGDAAHAMPPHAGAGAGQAIEDAYILASVFSVIDRDSPTQKQVEAAFAAYEAVRQPRYQMVLDMSRRNMSLWSDLFDEELTGVRLEKWREGIQGNFEAIWRHDLGSDGEKAKGMVREAVRSQ